MEKAIKIKIGKLEIPARLNDSRIAGLIWEILPVKAVLNTWGDEIYFNIPVKAKPDNPKEIVELGDLGYWPEGPAFCIFYGMTPVSRGDEIKPASSVEIVGKLEDVPQGLKKVASGETIILERDR